MIGFDVAQDMLNYVRAGIKDPRVELICASYEKIPAPDASVDVFIAVFSLQYMKNPDDAYKEIARVLKPGGKCIFVGPHPADMRKRATDEIVAGTRKQKVVRPVYGGKVVVTYPRQRFSHYLSPLYLSLFEHDAIDEYTDPGSDDPVVLFYAGRRKFV